MSSLNFKARISDW